MTLDDLFLSHAFFELFEEVMILLFQIQLGPSALLFTRPTNALSNSYFV